MASKNRNKPKSPAQSLLVAERRIPAAPEAEKLEQLHARLTSEHGDLMGDPEPLQVPASATPDVLQDLCIKALETQALLSLLQKEAADEKHRCEAARKGLESDREQTQKQSQAHEEKRLALEKERLQLEVARREVEQSTKKYAEQLKALDYREATLREQEDNALAGFSVQRREMLQGLADERDRYVAELKELHASALEARKNQAQEALKAEGRLQADLQQRWDDAQRQHAEERETLAATAADLTRERRKLERQREDLAADLLQLQDDKAHLAAKIDRLLDERIQQERQDRGVLQARLDSALTQASTLLERLKRYEDFFLQVGASAGSPGSVPEPTAVLDRMNRLNDDNIALRAQVARMPSEETARRLDELLKLEEEWRFERAELFRQKEQLRRELDQRLLSVTELQALQDRKAQLELHNAVLRADRDELAACVGQLVERQKTVNFYPNCAKLDVSSEHQQPVPTWNNLKDLKAFVQDLQQRIAYDPDPARMLYYRLSDLRIFLGGLAMSPLHLLQGISGTGKTSLPRAFARATGGSLTLVEVQAGWRDRQDLLGHHNAFEKRFVESRFLEALYAAQTPLYADRPCLIVLDEMNLSRPEQYFADILSALEQPPGERLLKIHTDEIPGAPRHFLKGRDLLIPDNVWFVGTANHDETTLEFADKTYDRAHVMELPNSREAFAVQPPQPRGPLSHAALQSAFDEAARAHQEAATTGFAYLNEALKPYLERQFGLSWGNRLERQTGRFAPVVIAGGGSLGEAVDHLLATKILRKLRDRYDIRTEALKRVQDKLMDTWSRLDARKDPERSLELLEAEIRRHEASPEEA